MATRPSLHDALVAYRGALMLVAADDLVSRYYGVPTSSEAMAKLKDAKAKALETARHYQAEEVTAALMSSNFTGA